MYQYFFQAHELLKQKNLEEQGLTFEFSVYLLKFEAKTFQIPVPLVSSEMSYFEDL